MIIWNLIIWIKYVIINHLYWLVSRLIQIIKYQNKYYMINYVDNLWFEFK
jgi:hypothetical protein